MQIISFSFTHNVCSQREPGLPPTVLKMLKVQILRLLNKACPGDPAGLLGYVSFFNFSLLASSISSFAVKLSTSCIVISVSIWSQDNDFRNFCLCSSFVSHSLILSIDFPRLSFSIFKIGPPEGRSFRKIVLSSEISSLLHPIKTIKNIGRINRFFIFSH